MLTFLGLACIACMALAFLITFGAGIGTLFGMGIDGLLRCAMAVAFCMLFAVGFGFAGFVVDAAQNEHVESVE